MIKAYEEATVEELEVLAALIHDRNKIDDSISSLIGRPAIVGHIGEYIASMVFDIRLEVAATHRHSDGHFASGPLAGCTVNIKFYAKQEGVLDVAEDDQPDYFLVLAGPVAAASSSRGGARPLTIEHVYLFDGKALAAAIRRRGVKFGVAVSIPKAQWQQAEIFPNPATPELPVTQQQRRLLALFSPAALM
jgi:hypothetical protein